MSLNRRKSRLINDHSLGSLIEILLQEQDKLTPFQAKTQME